LFFDGFVREKADFICFGRRSHSPEKSDADENKLPKKLPHAANALVLNQGFLHLFILET